MQNHRHKFRNMANDTEVELLINVKAVQRENRNQMTNVGNGA